MSTLICLLFLFAYYCVVILLRVSYVMDLILFYQYKGRPIQVAGSITERRSSMDTRRPSDRDSDVVIQVIFPNLGTSSFSSIVYLPCSTAL